MIDRIKVNKVEALWLSSLKCNSISAMKVSKTVIVNTLVRWLEYYFDLFAFKQSLVWMVKHPYKICGDSFCLSIDYQKLFFNFILHHLHV